LIRGLRTALLRYWRAWVVYTVVTAGYLVVLAVALGTSATKPRLPISAASTLSFGWELIRDTVVPGSVGGPWQWFPVSGGSFAFAAPAHILVALAGAVAAVVIIASVWGRWTAARAWVIFAGWIVLADILPVAIGRLNTLDAPVLGLETRYVADAMPVLAVCLGLAFLPLAGQRPGSTTHGRHGAWSGEVSQTAMAGLIGLYAFSSIWSVQAYLSVTTGSPSASYIANAAKAVKLAPRGTTVMNVGVSADMVEGLFGIYALQSKVIGDIAPGKLRWTRHPSGTIDGLRIFGADGRLYLAYVNGAPSLPLPAGKKCWPTRRGKIVVLLKRPSAATTGMLRIGYLSFAPTPITVMVEYRTNAKALIVRPGLHAAYVPITGSVQRITVVNPGGGLCIGDAEAGNLGPNVFASALPPKA